MTLLVANNGFPLTVLSFPEIWIFKLRFCFSVFLKASFPFWACVGPLLLARTEKAPSTL